MPKIIIITGVSAVGKSSICEVLRNTSNFFFPVSSTTRELSDRDISSVKKYTKETPNSFLKKVDEGYFLEWKKAHENYYGTPLSCLREGFNLKKDILLDVNLEGAISLLLKSSYDYDFKAKGFFIWRGINPLKDFRDSDLRNYVQTELLKRDPNIKEKDLHNRLISAIADYSLVMEKQNLFTFIENRENDLEKTVADVKDNFTPTFSNY